MLVRATDMSVRLKVKIKELHRLASPGEEFEVSPMRYEVLSGHNRYKAVFVVAVKSAKSSEVIEEPKVEEEPVAVEESIIDEPEVEEPKKSGRGHRKATEQQDAS